MCEWEERTKKKNLKIKRKRDTFFPSRGQKTLKENKTNIPNSDRHFWLLVVKLTLVQSKAVLADVEPGQLVSTLAETQTAAAAAPRPPAV